MLHKAEGIVIRNIDYGESHKIVVLYTKEYGKISVMARGARKVKSRLSAVTQLFTYGEYVYYQSGQMGNLNAGDIVVSHHALRNDLHMAAYAAYIAEMVDRIAGEERSEYLFEQLKAGLSALEEGKDPEIVVSVFEMKMLALAGYSPVLDRCVSCGERESDFAASAASGGVLCRNCRAKDARAIPLTEGVWKLLRLLQQIDLRRIGKTEVKPATKAQLKRCLREFMDTYVDVKWKSRHFLDQMDKYDL